ncbi:hypothetical protein JTB14_037231 [Gonioctena quinquepunctata]|nr:hypothetical protein JTB14_037231 [Gonioctena quinquepunctata]
MLNCAKQVTAMIISPCWISEKDEHQQICLEESRDQLSSAIGLYQGFGTVNISEVLELSVEVFLSHLTHKLLYAHRLAQIREALTHKLQEVKLFCVNILMSIKRLPSYRDSWSTKLKLRDAHISQVMPRSTSDWLLRNIHLNDNPQTGRTHYDKLYKVRPLLNEQAGNFTKYYKPSREVYNDDQ